MKLEHSRVGDVTLLEFSGEFDAFNLPPIQKAVDEILDRGETRLVLQLARLTFLNSSALGYLIKVRRRAQEAGGDCVLAEPGRFVRKLLATVGLDRLYSIYETTPDAMRHFGGGVLAPGADLSGEEADEALRGESAVLFALEAEGRERKYVGKIASLYADGLKFRWIIPGWSRDVRPPISTANFEKVIQVGAKVPVKFRQPFLVQGKYFEMATKIVRVGKDTLDDGTTEAMFVVKYLDAKPDDVALLRRFVSDMEQLRQELGGAQT